MKNQGFTLIELLAVIIILAVILTIAIPSISGMIGSATTSAFKSDARMVLKQLDYEKIKDEEFDVTTVNETKIKTDFNISNENYDSLIVDIVDNKPYILIIGKNKWAGLKACGTIKKMNVVAISDTETCEDVGYSDYIPDEGVNAPRLADGMIPAMYYNGNWVKADTTNTNTTYEWYSYTTTDKKWANSVTVTNNRETYLSSAVGTTIAMADINAFWTWIPRYAYQIATNYHTGTAGTVNIKFLIDDTDTTIDKTAIEDVPTYSDADTQSNYITQPAFTFGTTELTGFWIAKFEPSGTTASIDYKPGASRLSNVSVGNMFRASRNMETNNRYGWSLASGLNTDGTFTTDTNNVDIHMMKNIEWGAVAYLSQSTFGKNAEVTYSPNYSYTGGGSGTTYATSTDQSTTGNIHGIYDMAGGAYEYVMGNYNNTAGSSGLTPSSINDKYIDRYPTTASGYTATIYGDAVYETSSATKASTSWYGGYCGEMSTSYPWLFRGGYYGGGPIFFINLYTGTALFDNTWRSIVLVGEGL